MKISPSIPTGQREPPHQPRPGLGGGGEAPHVGLLEGVRCHRRTGKSRFFFNWEVTLVDEFQNYQAISFVEEKSYVAFPNWISRTGAMISFKVGRYLKIIILYIFIYSSLRESGRSPVSSRKFRGWTPRGSSRPCRPHRPGRRTSRRS